jgi:hypothetical protein
MQYYSWLRHYVTSWKVAGLRPNEVIDPYWQCITFVQFEVLTAVTMECMVFLDCSAVDFRGSLTFLSDIIAPIFRVKE